MPSNHLSKLNHRTRAILGFSLLMGWLVALPFQGKVLFAVAEIKGIDAGAMMLVTILLHMTGLMLCGFFVKDQAQAKKLLGAVVVACIVGSLLLLSSSILVWEFSLYGLSFLSGLAVACWSLWLRALSTTSERLSMTASLLIGSNLCMTVLDVIAINLSAMAGLVGSVLVLLLALVYLKGLPTDGNTGTNVDGNAAGNSGSSPNANEATADLVFPAKVQLVKPMAALYLFVMILTINSGLMYAVILPAYEAYAQLVSWYWAIPYIAAIFVVKALDVRHNQNQHSGISRYLLLSIAIAMMGFSFLAYAYLDKSAANYVLINTLMMGAFGICDLFWWSILGELLDHTRDPVRLFGIGLSSNLLGILIGLWLSRAFGSLLIDPGQLSRVTMISVLVILALLPVLFANLNRAIVHLGGAVVAPGRALPGDEEEFESVPTTKDVILRAKLTDRENEILMMILRGNTNPMIAEQLGITQNTLKFHLKNLYSKFGVHNKTELLKEVNGK